MLQCHAEALVVDMALSADEADVARKCAGAHVDVDTLEQCEVALLYARSYIGYINSRARSLYELLTAQQRHFATQGGFRSVMRQTADTIFQDARVLLSLEFERLQQAAALLIAVSPTGGEDVVADGLMCEAAIKKQRVTRVTVHDTLNDDLTEDDNTEADARQERPCSDMDVCSTTSALATVSTSVSVAVASVPATASTELFVRAADAEGDFPADRRDSSRAAARESLRAASKKQPQRTSTSLLADVTNDAAKKLDTRGVHAHALAREHGEDVVDVLWFASKRSSLLIRTRPGVVENRAAARDRHLLHVSDGGFPRVAALCGAGKRRSGGGSTTVLHKYAREAVFGLLETG